MIELSLGGAGPQPTGSDGIAMGAVYLAIDGVSLLPEADAEPLSEVLEGLASAAAALTRRVPVAQVGLPRCHLELCCLVEEDAAHLVVVSPGGPRVLREVRGLPLADLVVALNRELQRHGRSVLRATGPSTPAPAVTVHRPAVHGVGYTCLDAMGAWSVRRGAGEAPLARMLVPGTLTLGARARTGYPVLQLLSLVRDARARPSTLPTGVTPELLFHAGLALCIAVHRLGKGLQANPWLEALHDHAVEGLASLRPAARAAAAPSPAPVPARPSEGELTQAGVVRRISMVPTWEREVPLGGACQALYPLAGGVLAVAPRAAAYTSGSGAAGGALEAERALAASPSGLVLATDAGRLRCHDLLHRGARWFRRWEGTLAEGPITPLGRRLLVGLEGKGLLALDALTGHEDWRFEPPRVGRAWATIGPAGILVSTESGQVHGLDEATGVAVFRIRGPLPCAGAPVTRGELSVSVLARGSQSVLFAFRPLAEAPAAPGAIAWTRELALAAPQVPVAAGKRLFLAGQRDGESILVCLSMKGEIIFERPLPCEPGGLSVLAHEGSVIVVDRRGAVVRVLADGHVGWVLGAAADRLEHDVPARLHRGVLIVPGSPFRFVEPRGGRVQGAVDAGPHVAAFTVDGRFSFYTCTDLGHLRAWRRGAVLAVQG